MVDGFGQAVVAAECAEIVQAGRQAVRGLRQPQKRAGIGPAIGSRLADDLAEFVKRMCIRAIAAQRAQIAHHRVAIDKRTAIAVVADHPAGIVDRQGIAPILAQRTEVGHDAIVPEERVGVPLPRFRVADDLADFVDVVGPRIRTAQRAQRDNDRCQVAFVRNAVVIAVCAGSLLEVTIIRDAVAVAVRPSRRRHTPSRRRTPCHHRGGHRRNTSSTQWRRRTRANRRIDPRWRSVLPHRASRPP